MAEAFKLLRRSIPASSPHSLDPSQAVDWTSSPSVGSCCRVCVCWWEVRQWPSVRFLGLCVCVLATETTALMCRCVMPTEPWLQVSLKHTHTSDRNSHLSALVTPLLWMLIKEELVSEVPVLFEHGNEKIFSLNYEKTNDLFSFVVCLYGTTE